jgi:hypothetical protein
MMVGLIGMATMASAWHAVVTAESDCHGVVSYRTAAWDGATANPGIEIAYSRHATAGPWTRVTVSAFDSADNFSFAGTFSPTPDSPGTTITVRAMAVLPWVGQTTVEQAPQYADVIIPARCPVPLSVKLSCPSSVVYGKATTFTAAAEGGVTPYTYRWTLNGATTGGNSSTLTVVLNSSKDLLSVSVADINDHSATASASCTGTHPAPKVTMSCPASFTYGHPATWTATATPGVPGDKLSYRWAVDGVQVGSDSPSVVTTLNSGKNVLSVTVAESFADGTTSASSASQACISRVVVLIPPLVIVKTPVEPPEVTAAPVVPQRTPPFTGSHVLEQLALATGLLGAGLILVRLTSIRGVVGGTGAGEA